MPFNFNTDGSLLPFTDAQISAMGISTLGVEDGTHPQFTFEVSSNTARAEYLVYSDQLDNFICFMLGGQTKYTSGGVSALSRLPPQEIISYGGGIYTNFAAVKVEDTVGHQFTEDFTTTLLPNQKYPIPNYTQQRVRILFQQVPFDIAADGDVLNETQRYVQTLPSNSQTDFLSLPGGTGKFVLYPGQTAGQFPDRFLIPHGVLLAQPQSTIARKWIRLPLDCWGEGSDLYATMFGDGTSDVQGIVGTVNRQEFLGYPQGTLLMLNPEEELVLDQTGGQVWNLTYKMSFRPQGHNYFWIAPSGGAVGNGAGYFQARIDGVGTYLDSGSPITSQQCYFGNSDFMGAFQV